MKTRARVRVFGRVQGVLFRHYTVAMAKKLGISGYVRNLDDGSVEAVYEGEKEAVGEMIEWSKKGPPHAQVTSFRFTWEEPTDEFADFTVEY